VVLVNSRAQLVPRLALIVLKALSRLFLLPNSVRPVIKVGLNRIVPNLTVSTAYLVLTLLVLVKPTATCVLKVLLNPTRKLCPVKRATLVTTKTQSARLHAQSALLVKLNLPLVNHLVTVAISVSTVTPLVFSNALLVLLVNSKTLLLKVSAKTVLAPSSLTLKVRLSVRIALPVAPLLGFV
jgi:hypothetical protein